MVTKLRKTSKATSGWKGLKALAAALVGLAAFTELMGGSALDFSTATKATLVAAAIGAIRAVLNYVKHSRGGGPKGVLPFLLLALFPSFLYSCTTVSSEFREVDTEGVETSFNAVSRAAPFGKIDTSLHEFSYRYGGEENIIAVGQSADGVSNEGQIQALQAAIEAFAPILNVLATAAGNYVTQMSVPEPPPPSPLLAPLVIPGR